MASYGPFTQKCGEAKQRHAHLQRTSPMARPGRGRGHAGWCLKCWRALCPYPRQGRCDQVGASCLLEPVDLSTASMCVCSVFIATSDHLLRTLLSVADIWIMPEVCENSSWRASHCQRHTGGEASRASSSHSDHVLRNMQTLKRHGNIERRSTGPGRVSSVHV